MALDDYTPRPGPTIVVYDDIDIRVDDKIYPAFPDYPPLNIFTDEPRPSAKDLNDQAEKSIRDITVVGSNSVIPIVYGEDRLYGQIISVAVKSSKLYISYAFSEGRIEGFLKTLVNGTDISTTSGISYVEYLGLLNPPVDPWLSLAISGYADTNDNLAYLVLQANNSSLTGFPRVEAIVKGKCIYDPRKDDTNGGVGNHRLSDPSTWEYSANPTLCFTDYITQYVGWGINWPSVIDNADENDIIYTDPITGNTSVNREIGITLLKPSKVTGWVKSFQEIMAAFVVWENGKIRIIPDRADVLTYPDVNIAASITADDIIDGSFKLVHKSSDLSPTVVIVDYRDSSHDDWPVAFQTAEAAGVSIGTTPRKVARINLPSVHKAPQAKRIAIKRLNHYINDLSGQMSVFDTGIEYQIGSIIDVTHPIGLVNKLFRILNVSINGTDWAFSFEEYDPAAHSNEVIDDPTFPDLDIGDPLNPPAPTSLVLKEKLFRGQNGTVSSRLRIEWTGDSSYAFFNEYRVTGFIEYLITGAITFANSGTQLTDTTAGFITDNRIAVDDIVSNLTDGSTATVVSVDSETIITHSQLSGGTGNDWGAADEYSISGLEKIHENKVKNSPDLMTNVENLAEGDDFVSYYVTVFVTSISTFGVESAAIEGRILIDADLAVPNGPPIVISDANYLDEMGNTYSILNINFNGIDWIWAAGYRVQVVSASGLVTLETTVAHLGAGESHVVPTPAVDQGKVYTAKVWAMNGLGDLSSVPSVGTHQADGLSVRPSPVPLTPLPFTGVEASLFVSLTWTAAVDTDLKGYIIRRLSKSDWEGVPADIPEEMDYSRWEHANIVQITERNDATSVLVPNQPVGEWYYGIKAIDKVYPKADASTGREGHESLIARWTFVPVTADIAGVAATKNLYVAYSDWTWDNATINWADMDWDFSGAQYASGSLLNMHIYEIYGDGVYACTTGGRNWTTRFGAASAWSVNVNAGEKWFGDLTVASEIFTETWDTGADRIATWSWNAQIEHEGGGTLSSFVGLAKDATPTTWVDHAGAAVNAEGRFMRAVIKLDAVLGNGFRVKLPMVAQWQGKIVEYNGQETLPGTGQPNTVTFPAPYGGIPKVTLQAHGADARHALVNNVTTDDFDIWLFDETGAQIGGLVDWQSIGT